MSCASTTYVEHFPLRLSAVCELHPELIQAHTPSMSSNMSSGSSKNSGRGACDYDFKLLPGLIRRPHPAHWHHRPGIYHQNTIGNHYKLPSYARAQSSYKLIQTHGAGNHGSGRRTTCQCRYCTQWVPLSAVRHVRGHGSVHVTSALRVRSAKPRAKAQVLTF